MSSSRLPSTLPALQNVATPTTPNAEDAPTPGPSRSLVSVPREIATGFPEARLRGETASSCIVLDARGRRQPADLEQGETPPVGDILELRAPIVPVSQSTLHAVQKVAAPVAVLGVFGGVAMGVGATIAKLTLTKPVCGESNAGGTGNTMLVTSAVATALGLGATGVSRFLLQQHTRQRRYLKDGRVVDVLKNVIASTPSERQQAVHDHRASNWSSLRSHFYDLSGKNAPARDRAAAALARNRALNTVAGIDAARLPDIADVLRLVDDMKDILDEEHEESPPMSRQYADVAARLFRQKTADPLTALWQLNALQTPATLADGASPEHRLAATLLADAGCDYDSNKHARARAEAQSAAAVTPAARTASPTGSEGADIGQQLPPYSPPASENNGPARPALPPGPSGRGRRSPFFLEWDVIERDTTFPGNARR